MNDRPISRRKTAVIFIFTIVFGFMLFIIPNLFFGITKVNGGIKGVNLLIIGCFQFVTVTALVYGALKLMNRDMGHIGLSRDNWPRDAIVGLTVGLAWAALQFGWLIPATGGSERADITRIRETMDGTFSGMLFYVGLGVIGGGITEEIYNRGFFITVLRDLFKNPKLGLWVAATLSVLFFAAGHLPTNTVEWIDILVPTIAYTILFIVTKRLTAPIVAHSVYNGTAVVLAYYLHV